MNKFKNIPSFTTITLFILLGVIGIALLPLLSVNLQPSRSLPSVSISYTMRGATGELIDAEVTTPIEGTLSTISGIKKLTSRTGKGYGRISLEMEKGSDMDAIRFEVATLMRQLYDKLPEDCSLPVVSVNKPDEENRIETLLSYQVSGQGSKNDLVALLEREFAPVLSGVEGVHEVSVKGAERRRMTLSYDQKLLEEYGISATEISSAIRNQQFARQQLGFTGTSGKKEQFPVVLSSGDKDSFSIHNIRIQTGKGEIPLSKLVDAEYTTRKPYSYYRINGLNAVYLTIRAQKGVNSLSTGSQVKEQIAQLQNSIPQLSLNNTYDATIYLREELNNISLRIALSVFLLLLFILLVSRSWRYLFICFSGILMSLIVAFIFYVLFQVEIHLYSLAGITLSLGIIIDNIIIMIDHLRHKNNLKVYLAILASTLTTIGALLVIFFLDDSQKLRLLDFALVIIINLSVSLLVSLFLIPAMMQKIPLKGRVTRMNIRRKRRVLKLSRLYERLIIYTYKKRALFIILGILTFGLPVHQLPQNINKRGFWPETYNATLGSHFFGQYIHPMAEKVLGGVLRPFSTDVKSNYGNDSASRTRLNIRGSMPQGATLEQMNTVILKVENYLSQFSEIDRFQTNIYGAQSGNISVWFKKEHELEGFPFSLKEMVQTYCIDIGGMDWSISGVGRGFNNSLREGHRNSRLVLYGYNLEMLKRFAWELRDSLNTITRVEKVFVNGRETYMDHVAYEQILSLDRNQMLGAGINSGYVLSQLAKDSKEEYLVANTTNSQGDPLEIVLSKQKFDYRDKWHFKQQPIETGNERMAKVNRLGHIHKQRVSDLINKENMEYKLVVEFDFIGSYGQKNLMIGELAERFNQDLPIGFRIAKQSFSGGYWQDDKKDNTRLLLILLITAIIYLICAVLLESLLQPLAVILMIPLTFIGVFLAFWLFELPFGDGGYASLLLLSGLTVNAALYIVNDFNQNKKEKPQLKHKASYYRQKWLSKEAFKSIKWWKRMFLRRRKKHIKTGYTRHYLKAFNHKIIPIVLTIFSTVLGFVPFLLGGKSDPFWFSLAAGTMGGLVFSILALYIYLPILLRMGRSFDRLRNRMGHEVMKRSSTCLLHEAEGERTDSVDAEGKSA